MELFLDGKSDMTDIYHQIRFKEDSKREVLWKALWNYYFQYQIDKDDTVLDLGCGYGNFINNVKAKRRIAIDLWKDFPKHISPGIETIITKLTDLSDIENSSVDFAFASNVFEHMTQDELSNLLVNLKNKLTSKGKLTIIQPNYRYCSSEYFDDYTHISIWSHISLSDFLIANGYEVSKVEPRFLPLTIKSSIPAHPLLIGLYLSFPFKPFGKQMLICAKPK